MRFTSSLFCLSHLPFTLATTKRIRRQTVMVPDEDIHLDEQSPLAQHQTANHRKLADRKDDFELLKRLLVDSHMSLSMPTTAAPTATPTSSPNPPEVICEDLRMQLQSVTPSGDLLDGTTPQGAAFAWVSQDPAHDEPCVFDSATVSRYALVVLFYSLGGSAWDVRTNWLTGESECSWFGIQCNEEGSVIGIDLGKIDSVQCSVFLTMARHSPVLLVLSF